MKRITALPFAVAAALLAAPLAHAESGFAVTGGVGLVDPKSDSGTVAGGKADIDGDPAATLGLSWFFNDNVAVELWGSPDKFDHTLSLDGAKAANFSQRPIALSAQYHYTINDTFRPFAGLGYFQSNIDNEHLVGALPGQRVGMDTGEGPMATVGVDFLMGEHWFARADARYLKWDSDVAVDGVKVGEASIDPMVYGASIGYKF